MGLAHQSSSKMYPVYRGGVYTREHSILLIVVVLAALRSCLCVGASASSTSWPQKVHGRAAPDSRAGVEKESTLSRPSGAIHSEDVPGKPHIYLGLPGTAVQEFCGMAESHHAACKIVVDLQRRRSARSRPQRVINKRLLALKSTGIYHLSLPPLRLSY